MRFHTATTAAAFSFVVGFTRPTRYLRRHRFLAPFSPSLTVLSITTPWTAYGTPLRIYPHYLEVQSVWWKMRKKWHCGYCDATAIHRCSICWTLEALICDTQRVIKNGHHKLQKYANGLFKLLGTKMKSRLHLISWSARRSRTWRFHSIC